MTTSTPAPQPEPVPPDDPRRELTVATPDDPGLPHLSVVGDTYTVVLSGDDTGGRFTLIDMYVPPGGGPPLHLHDYEETFVVLDGRLDLTFRGTTQAVGAGTTINVPSNAPHQFRNSSDAPTRLLCISAPPGQDEFFAAIGDRVPGRTSPPPHLDQEARAARIAKAIELAPRYRSELLPPAAGRPRQRSPGQRHQAIFSALDLREPPKFFDFRPRPPANRPGLMMPSTGLRTVSVRRPVLFSVRKVRSPGA